MLQDVVFGMKRMYRSPDFCWPIGSKHEYLGEACASSNPALDDTSTQLEMHSGSAGMGRSWLGVVVFLMAALAVHSATAAADT
jgi:hypothetical protein